MSLDNILLALLREPASGYDLKTTFDEGIRYFGAAELSQIYPALQRMERRGLLRSREEPPDKGPPRRVYQRTAAGREELLRWLQSGPILGVERFAYIAQLVFLHEADDLELTLAFLQQLCVQLRQTLDVFRRFEREAMEMGQGDPVNLPIVEFHEYLGLQMGIHAISARVKWCKQAIALVENRMQTGDAS